MLELSIPFNSKSNNNIQYNSGQIVAIIFHSEYKIIMPKIIV